MFNSSGKTSLIEILNFLLGGKVEEDSIVLAKELAGVVFTGSFYLRGDLWRIARCTSDTSRIVVLEGNPARFGIKLKKDRKSEESYISLVTWKEVLGNCYFGLPCPVSGSVFDEAYAPSFRSLVGFFVRRQLEGGFAHANRYAEKQQEVEAAISLFFLLGLDWRLAQEFIGIRERRRVLDRLQKSSQNELFAAVLGKASELRPQLIAAERRAERFREEVDNFRVVAAYDELSRRAADIKSSLQVHSRRQAILRETLAGLESALASEKPVEKTDVSAMFSAVGVQLPGVSLRRFEEVAKFHDSVVENRRRYLSREVKRVSDELDKVSSTVDSLGADRARVLRNLDGAGALKDLTELQALKSEAESKVVLLRSQLAAAERIESEGTQIDIDTYQLQQRIQNDLRERHQHIDQAQRLLLEFSNRVYADRDATLQIDASKFGPNVKIQIPGDRGGGVHNVEIFLLDLVLFELASSALGGGRFLIHDSHLFDGVDERQIALCLQLARDAAWQFQGQYIVTMNSDVFSKLPATIWQEGDRYVIPVRITDEPTGGLFGIQFES
jgi:uncharacterized protein YydD (DUF2326 family)